MLPPPPPPITTASTKHKPSNLPEPAPKRKTLAERAGEVSRQHAAAPPSSRPLGTAVRSTVANGARSGTSYHTGSLRSMSNASSGSSRNTSASSVFSGSVGPGMYILCDWEQVSLAPRLNNSTIYLDSMLINAPCRHATTISPKQLPPIFHSLSYT